VRPLHNWAATTTSPSHQDFFKQSRDRALPIGPVAYQLTDSLKRSGGNGMFSTRPARHQIQG